MKSSRGLHIFLLAAAAVLLVGGYAQADPVNFLPAAGTSVQFKFNADETCTHSNGTFGPCTTVGDVLSGIFAITTINNQTGSTVFWASGMSDNTQLTGRFTNLTVSNVNVISSTQTNISFTGGAIQLYNVPCTGVGCSGPFNPSLGPPQTDAELCGGPCPSPWLTANFVPGISTVDPTATLFSNVTSATSPLTGTGTGILSVTGGSAASHFGTTMSLSSDISTCPSSNPALEPLCTGADGWPIVAHDPVTAVTSGVPTVPEPVSLLLLGLGVGALAIRMRFGREQ